MKTFQSWLAPARFLQFVFLILRGLRLREIYAVIRLLRPLIIDWHKA